MVVESRPPLEVDRVVAGHRALDGPSEQVRKALAHLVGVSAGGLEEGPWIPVASYAGAVPVLDDSDRRPREALHPASAVRARRSTQKISSTTSRSGSRARPGAATTGFDTVAATNERPSSRKKSVPKPSWSRKQRTLRPSVTAPEKAPAQTTGSVVAPRLERGEDDLGRVAGRRRRPLPLERCRELVPIVETPLEDRPTAVYGREPGIPEVRVIGDTEGDLSDSLDNMLPTAVRGNREHSARCIRLGAGVGVDEAGDPTGVPQARRGSRLRGRRRRS